MTDENFLRALYGGMLGRQPDAEGLKQHLLHLQAQQANPLRYERLVEAFTRGTEFRLVAEQRWFPNGSNAFLPDLTGVCFEHVVSLGNFCHAAMALKRAAYRAWSGPFDWVFSNVSMASHCISDDFAVFLDPQYWRSVPVAERHTPEANLCEHLFYREKFGVPFVFNHHDPSASREHAAYFHRCVNRFRQVLRSSAWKMFLIVSPAAVSLEHMRPLCSALECATSNFVVVALHFNVVEPKSNPPLMPEVIRTQRLRHDVLRVEMDVASPSNGVAFGNSMDNRILDKFLATFRCRPVELHA